jgi:hypothetical protein
MGPRPPRTPQQHRTIQMRRRRADGSRPDPEHLRSPRLRLDRPVGSQRTFPTVRALHPTPFRHLDAVGLSTTETCGDAPRNMLGCPLAGIAEDEIIDGTPHPLPHDHRYRPTTAWPDRDLDLRLTAKGYQHLSLVRTQRTRPCCGRSATNDLHDGRGDACPILQSETTVDAVHMMKAHLNGPSPPVRGSARIRTNRRETGHRSLSTPDRRPGSIPCNRPTSIRLQASFSPQRPARTAAAALTPCSAATSTS